MGCCTSREPGGGEKAQATESGPVEAAPEEDIDFQEARGAIREIERHADRAVQSKTSARKEQEAAGDFASIM